MLPRRGAPLHRMHRPQHLRLLFRRIVVGCRSEQLIQRRTQDRRKILRRLPGVDRSRRGGGAGRGATGGAFAGVGATGSAATTGACAAAASGLGTRTACLHRGQRTRRPAYSSRAAIFVGNVRNGNRAFDLGFDKSVPFNLSPKIAPRQRRSLFCDRSCRQAFARSLGDSHLSGAAPAEPRPARNGGSAGASPSRCGYVPTPRRTLFYRTRAGKRSELSRPLPSVGSMLVWPADHSPTTHGGVRTAYRFLTLPMRFFNLFPAVFPAGDLTRK